LSSSLQLPRSFGSCHWLQLEGTTNLSVCGKHQMVAKIFNLFPDFFLFCFKVKICHLVVWTFVRLQLSFSDNVHHVLTVEASFNNKSAVILF